MVKFTYKPVEGTKMVRFTYKLVEVIKMVKFTGRSYGGSEVYFSADRRYEDGEV